MLPTGGADGVVLVPLSGLVNGAGWEPGMVDVIGGAVAVLLVVDPGGGVEPGTGCNCVALVGAGEVDEGLAGSVPEVRVTRESACAIVNVSTAGATVPASLLVGPSDDRDEVNELLGVAVVPLVDERNGLLLPAEDGEL